MSLTPEYKISKGLTPEKEPKIILHICLREEWERAQQSGEYRGEDFESDRFIHCSTGEQIGGIAGKVPEKGDFVVLKIDSSKVVPEIKYEKATNGKFYPHIYGPLNIDAVISPIEDFHRNNS